MITKFLGRVFSGRIFRAPQPKIIPFSTHGIARERISSCALQVTQTLQRHDFTAFVVGGAVRDLLLGREPKDFDVATDATPEEVRRLFRRSRIIGRRFRLVHVMCGAETVEVSTFRGGHTPEDAEAHARRRARPHPARQRVRHAGGGCDAARFHHQCAVLRSGDAGNLGLPRRRRRPEEAAAAHDRRSRAALSRRPGAHAARRAARRQAAAARSSRARARRSAASPTCCRTCRRRGCSTRC